MQRNPCILQLRRPSPRLNAWCPLSLYLTKLSAVYESCQPHVQGEDGILQYRRCGHSCGALELPVACMRTRVVHVHRDTSLWTDMPIGDEGLVLPACCFLRLGLSLLLFVDGKRAPKNTIPFQNFDGDLGDPRSKRSSIDYIRTTYV